MARPLNTYERIWKTVGEIPYGHVATYGQVAARAGLPRRARLVGHALRIKPDEVSIPWYRVVNAKGRLSFPPGSMPYNQQRSCLEAESIFFANGRINLKRFGWHPSLDEFLWRPTPPPDFPSQ